MSLWLNCKCLQEFTHIVGLKVGAETNMSKSVLVGTNVEILASIASIWDVGQDQERGL